MKPGMIANQLGEVSQPVYIQKAGQALSEIIKQYQEKPGILISAGASVGVSPRGENGEQIFRGFNHYPDTFLTSGQNEG